MQNHFDLFQLSPQFDVDMAQLDRAFRDVQAQVHPDKFVSASSAEQRVAMQWATRANEAYQTLKNPLKRASYLCELNGVGLQAESNTAMPMAFLMQQMEWREELDEARQNSAALLRLETHINQAHRQQITQIAEQLAQPDYHQAAQLIRQLMFLEKFSEDVANAQEE
ncbi:Fe-S protein assembly co-chaperone HscB [Solimicrobium silvestre]|uniref:Co-chaperone protein HscB homolog n=1 Tax=Solimicrobium silvestre TaxID=2099400 RepID=A0A2S9GU53_9BURK|nr:Fe-S protein assembly co-chaperone HscB [Solimicrobium silvestre]PRC91240.1 hscB: Fe-S protein assembly co-chaperone HscB [Solimicrobium silvestre]